MKRMLLAATAVAFAVTGPALPQESAAVEFPDTCSVQSSSDIIYVVVCENAELEQAELVEAGKAACGATLPCGAWIWNDAASAPQTAPENHDGLNQAQVTSARAVWVAETESLIEISEVK